MRFSKEKMAGISNRKRPNGLFLLLLALGMVAMCAVILHQLKEGREVGLLLQEREQKLSTLQILLQKERENSKEVKRKLDGMKAKTLTLKNQKMELNNKLTGSQNYAAQLKKLKTKLEATLTEKQIQVDKLTVKTEKFISTTLKVTNLTSLLKQKEAEVEKMKKRLTEMALVENSTAQNGKSQLESFSRKKEGKEVDLKAENVSNRSQQEDEVNLKDTEENQVLRIKVKGTEDGKGDAKRTEEKEVQSKEKDESNRNVEEINEQLESTEGSELVAKSESKNAVKGVGEEDNMIGSSSDQSQYELEEESQVQEGIKDFSTYNKSTTDSESSDEKLSSSKKEIEQERDNRREENREAKNDKTEDDQRKTYVENSKAEERSTSIKDLRLQGTINSESNRSSQGKRNVFTETIQETKSIGQSETVENTEESESKSKTSDGKQAKSEGRAEKVENLEDKQNMFPSAAVERGVSNDIKVDKS